MNESETSKDPQLPVQKVEMIKVGDIPSIFATGIELSPKTQQVLGLDDEMSFCGSKMDYVALATDQLVDPLLSSGIKDEKFRGMDELSHLLNKSEQHNVVQHKVAELFNYDEPQNMEMLHQFKNAINSSSDKPFLVVQGHGVSWSGSKGAGWNLGNEDGTESIALGQYLGTLDFDKYSAILLVACNPAGLTLSNSTPDAAPIFYRVGNTGRLEHGAVARS